MIQLLIVLAIATFIPWYHHRRYYYEFRDQQRFERKREAVRMALCHIYSIQEKAHEQAKN